MRCLFRTIISMVSFAALALGLYLLYTVFINTPDSVTATVGGSSQVTEVSDVSLDPELDQEIREESARQATEIGETNAAGQNIVLQNAIISADSAITIDDGSGDGGSVSTNSIDTVAPESGGSSVGIDRRIVELEWPEQFRTGEAGAVRIALKPVAGGIEVSSPEIPTNTVIATPISLIDCYDNFDAYVTASIITPSSFTVETNDDARKQVQRDVETEWRWTLTPEREGTFVFTLALRMDWVLPPGQLAPFGECSDLAQAEFAFWGQSVQVEVVRVLGLITIQEASTAGTVLALLGLAGQVPFLYEVFAILLERRIQRRADRRRRRKSKRR